MYSEAIAKQHALRGSGISMAHGFEPVTKQNFAAKCMLIVTELDEGWEAVYDNGEDPLEVEMADTAIRLQQVLHDMWGTEWNYREPEVAPRMAPARYEELAWEVIRPLSKAVEAWRKGRDMDVRIGIELAFKATVKISYQLGIDLQAEVESKLKKNADRPHLHGKVQTV